jgi:hypothetical protein
MAVASATAASHLGMEKIRLFFPDQMSLFCSSGFVPMESANMHFLQS